MDMAKNAMPGKTVRTCIAVASDGWVDLQLEEWNVSRALAGVEELTENVSESERGPSSFTYSHAGTQHMRRRSPPSPGQPSTLGSNDPLDDDARFARNISRRSFREAIR
jgi:hypothetical protein